MVDLKNWNKSLFGVDPLKLDLALRCDEIDSNDRIILDFSYRFATQTWTLANN